MATDLNESNQNFLVYSAFYLAYLDKINGDEGEIKKVEDKIKKLKGDLGNNMGDLGKLVNKFSEKVNIRLGINKSKDE
tara:strand:+ start:124 stop:357 length:234 start_codon:yes stop_codon:yes gene_type:complete